MSNPSTQLANQSAPRDLKGLLSQENVKKQFALALPNHLSPERFCRVAITALSRNPKLAECTPESFMRCLLDLSAFGLEPDGRRAHLIPYKDQCTLVIDWKGLAELALRSGIIAKLHMDVVCENDVFDYDLGEVKAHKVNLREPRGAVYAAYAFAQTKTGEIFCDAMGKDEVDVIMKRSQGYKSAIQYNKSHPWLTDYNEMAKKTVFRRLSKKLPLSPEFRDAQERVDEEAHEIEIVTTPSASESKLFKETPALPVPSAEVEIVTAPEKPLVEPTSLTLAAQVHNLLQSERIKWRDVSGALIENEVTTEDVATVDEASEEVLQHVVSNWAAIVQIVKEGR